MDKEDGVIEELEALDIIEDINKSICYPWQMNKHEHYINPFTTIKVVTQEVPNQEIEEYLTQFRENEACKEKGMELHMYNLDKDTEIVVISVIKVIPRQEPDKIKTRPAVMKGFIYPIPIPN